MEPEKLLRFTVFDVRTTGRPAITDEDGITFELTQKEARRLLHLRQCDFSSMNDGQKCAQLSAQVWDRVLLMIKQLAEEPAGNL